MAKRKLPPKPAKGNGEGLAEPSAEPQPVGDGEARLEREAPKVPFTIVGIGASAGGLEAFTELIGALPEAINFAIVLVQHLAPDRKSGLAGILAPKTRIPICELTPETSIEPNNIYVIPPNVELAVEGGTFKATRRLREQPRPVPIDVFFRSLAEYAGSSAVGVVLSGTGSDGSLGLLDIKGAGGITLAQAPATAKYDGMPRAAIEAEAADMVLPADQIARELVVIASNRRAPRRSSADQLTNEESQLARIFSTLRGATGVDFTHYKPPTIRRRLERRLELHKVSTLEEYVALLEKYPNEVQELYRDILIHVTRFFREPDSFETLKSAVYPQILTGRRGDLPLRVWVPGCSTGEESYSVAISMLEFMSERGLLEPIQVFATDVSESAIEKARAGIFPASIAEDVSPERLRKFFTRVDNYYQVNKNVRGMCVFARQDLTRDPPFSRLDLIVCRNVLIYLTPPMQKRLLSAFHYALHPTGFLVLGGAETIGPHSDLFSLTDKKHRVYSKKSVERSMDLRLPHEYRPLHVPLREAKDLSSDSIQEEATRVILDKYGPPAVVVSPGLQILQFRGQTGRFLEPAAGEASFSILRMAREGLLFPLRTALAEARTSGTMVQRMATLKTVQGSHVVELEVIPLGKRGSDKYFVVVFKEKEVDAAPAGSRRGKGKKKAESAQAQPEQNERVKVLEQELAANREQLRSIIRDTETANEELQSANEEILSSNEELQSTNEELDTTNEELQSTNQELNTVNAELHNRNEELRRINADLVNLLANVQIAIVMLDSSLRIRRFTPMAERVLNLISGDVGRPISHIKPNIRCPHLDSLIAQATQEGRTVTEEVQDQNGRWFAMHIRPYQGPDNCADGAVLALFDIEKGKRNEGDLTVSRDYAEAALDLISLPLAVLDGNLSLQRANAAFCKLFGFEFAPHRGQRVSEIESAPWQIPQLLRTLEQLARATTPEKIEIELQRGTAGHPIKLECKSMPGGGGESTMILVTVRQT
jgi:two-component system CheB/CheR fusion protein